MTLAISEILKQVELLSPDEQQELTATLMEKTQQRARSSNGHSTATPLAPKPLVNDAEAEEEDDDDWLDTLVLKPIPPKDVYTIKVKLVDGGRLQPLRYDFGDLFDDEEEGEN